MDIGSTFGNLERNIMSDINTIIFKYKDYIACNSKTFEFIKDCEIDSYVNYDAQKVDFLFKKFFATREATLRSAYEYPNSFWQQFKKDYMPAWFVKKFPIKTNTRTVSFLATEVFPDIPYNKHPNMQVRFYGPLETLGGNK